MELRMGFLSREDEEKEKMTTLEQTVGARFIERESLFQMTLEN